MQTSSCGASRFESRRCSTSSSLLQASSCCRSSREHSGSRRATENPAWLILGLLTITLGLPYFLLSTTSPLLQAWFAQRYPGRNPYRLFALSNFASLLGLVGYPFLIEPWITTRVQAYSWSAGYVVFVVICAATAWRSRRTAPASTATRRSRNTGRAASAVSLR